MLFFVEDEENKGESKNKAILRRQSFTKTMSGGGRETDSIKISWGLPPKRKGGKRLQEDGREKDPHLPT